MWKKTSWFGSNEEEFTFDFTKLVLASAHITNFIPLLLHLELEDKGYDCLQSIYLPCQANPLVLDLSVYILLFLIAYLFFQSQSVSRAVPVH